MNGRAEAKSAGECKLCRADGTPFWQFLEHSKIAYRKSDFPFLTAHPVPRVRSVFSFREYLELRSKGEALAYLYAGLGRALNYVGPVLDLERRHGFNDHTDRHTLWVSFTVSELLQRAGHSFEPKQPFDSQTEVLAVLVGMMHDLGNLVSREEHSVYSVQLLNCLFQDNSATASLKTAWQRVEYAVQFHEEPVLAQHSVRLAAGDPLQWALVAADKLHVGRERLGSRSFATGVQQGALEQDSHIFLNALVVRSTWYLEKQVFVWHLDFSVDQLEKRFAAFTRGVQHRVWVPDFVQRLFKQQGARYRETYAQVFAEVYRERMRLAAESIFLLFPFVEAFWVRLSDTDTRGKVGSGQLLVWQSTRR